MKPEGGATRAAEAYVSLAIFVVAFVLRFAVAQWLAGEPVWDGHYYDFGARRIAEGHGYSDDRTVGGHVEWHPWCHYPVGYSAFLALFYLVLGAHAWTAHLANALVGALVAVVVHRIGLETLAPGRARLAGALVAIHPGLVVYGALVMGEVLSALGVMAAFWATIHGARTRGPRFGIVIGALLVGVGALIRPQALLCAPFLFLVGLRPTPHPLGRSKVPPVRVREDANHYRAPSGSRRRDGLLRGLGLAALACAVALVPVLPWTARNCKVMDGCALVSTNGGWNLAIGAFPRATGRFETLRSEDGCREVTGQVQQDRCWLAYGLANIARSPGRWLGLIPAKLSNTFDHESFAIEYLREARPDAWPEERRVGWRTALSALHRILVLASPLAFIALELRRGRFVQSLLLGATVLAGLVAITAEVPTFWPVLGLTCLLPWIPLPGRPTAPPGLVLPVVLLATTALTHAVFFGDDRYHMVVTPALVLLAAAALRQPAATSRTLNAHGADPREVRAAGEGKLARARL